jgi:hypothetical protein
VTHEEARAVLPAYAAGRVDEQTAAGVRAHVAGGCRECLDRIFAPRRMVRTARLIPVYGWPVPARRPPRSRGRAWLATAIVVGAAGLMAGSLLGTRGVRGAERRITRLAGRVGGLEREQALLGARLARAEAPRAPAAEPPAPAAGAPPAGPPPAPAADGEVRALRTVLGRREAELGRLRAALAGVGVRDDLLALPGSVLLPLAAVAPFRDGRGHLLYNPARRTVVLYAFGLPPAERYRLRLAGAGDTPPEIGPPFAPAVDGRAVVALRLGAVTSPFTTVEVRLEPSGRPVLLSASR